MHYHRSATRMHEIAKAPKVCNALRSVTLEKRSSHRLSLEAFASLFQNFTLS